jgi:hypothetical protein
MPLLFSQSTIEKNPSDVKGKVAHPANLGESSWPFLPGKNRLDN